MSATAAAKDLTSYRKYWAARFGVAPVEPQVDYAAAMAHVRRVIETIAPVDSQERFEGLGVRVIREQARFVSGSELEAGPFRVTARRFVVATGSRPFVPPIPGLDTVPFLTNETVFDLRERPEHLLVEIVARLPQLGLGSKARSWFVYAGLYRPTKHNLADELAIARAEIQDTKLIPVVAA